MTYHAPHATALADSLSKAPAAPARETGTFKQFGRANVTFSVEGVSAAKAPSVTAAYT